MTSDGRRDQRQTIGLKIRFKSATLSDFIEQNSADISRGGMFVKMSSPMPVGTLIKFDLRLDDDQSFVQGVGRVVWRREESSEGASAGMGIKFIKLDETSRGNLGTIIQNKVEHKKGESALPPSVVPVMGPPSKSPSPIAPVRPRSMPKKKQKTLVGTPSVAPQGAESDGDVDAEEERETAIVEQVVASKDSKQERSERSTTPPASHQEMSGGVEWDEEDSDPHEMATVIASIPEMNALLGDESRAGREDNTARVVIGQQDIKATSDGRREEDETEKLELAKHNEAMAARRSSEREASGSIPQDGGEKEDTWEEDGTKEPEAENGLLEHISDAIDSALYEGKGKAGKADASSEEGVEEGAHAEEQEGEAHEGRARGVEETHDRDGLERGESSGKGSGFAIAVLLMLGIAGVAIWYFMFGPGKLPEELIETFTEEEVFSTAPGEQDTLLAGEEQATTPAEEELGTSSGDGESETAPEEVAATTAIEVSVQPPGARLFLDGELQEGNAPFTLNIEHGKMIELRASAWGYVSQTKKLEVTEEPAKVELTLVKAEIHAVFKTEPRGAVIVVDGFRWGQTPNVVKKKGIQREFSYKITKSGYEELEGKVVARDWKVEDGVYSVTVGGELKPLEQTKPTQWRRSKPKTNITEKQADTAEKKAETKSPEKAVEPEKPAVKPEHPAVEKKPAAEKKPEAEKKLEAEKKPAPKKEPAEKKIQPQAVEENPF